jgi:putative OPT family oligopeptide transporter
MNGPRELTFKAVLAGVVMAIVFGSANAYLGMKAGMTVAATIPAAVIGLALFRLPFFRGGILEQNIMRTAASVGEALVAGAIFTIPAFLLADVGGGRIWTDLRAHFWEATFILLAGGLIGVMFIIVLRRPLCVESDLPFPESTASAEIVKAGEAGGSRTRYIFGAMGLGAALQILKSDKGLLLFREYLDGFIRLPASVVRHFDFRREPLAAVTHTGGIPFATPAISPALLGIGYIVGPRVGAINFSGGVIAWWILIPLLLFFDPDLPRRLGQGSEAPWEVVSYTIWYNIVRPIAVGAMLVGAGYTLYSMREALVRSLRGAMDASAHARPGRAADASDLDIPFRWIVLSTAALILPITAIYYHFTGSLASSIAAALIMTVAGFVLSAVGGYLVGLVGGSNQPVSGLTLAALVIAALVMLAMGVKGLSGVAAVLGVASVVCCACCTSGSLLQDLKAGHLLRGTPWKMEVVEIIAVVLVALTVMIPIIVLHESEIASGGIGGKTLPAPQAGLMAQLATGIAGGQMPWGLILMGVAFAFALILISAPSPMLIAVGMYLPFETVAAIFVGGVLRWIASRRGADEETGTLVASGLIAGEAIVGILLAVLFVAGVPSLTRALTGADELAVYTRYGGSLSLAAFALIAYALIVTPGRCER